MKILAVLAALVSTLLLSCGDGIFDAAKRAHDGYPLAAVLVYDGSAKIIITDGADYFREVGMYTMVSVPSMTLQVHMHRSGALFVADNSGNVHANAGNGWMISSPGGGIVQGFASNNDTVLAMVNKIVYEFDSNGSPPWKPVNDLTSAFTAPYNAQSIGNVDNHADPVIVTSNAINIMFYSYGDTTNPQATVNGMPGASFFDRKNGVYYAGDGSSLRTSSDSVFIAGGGLSIQSYTVLSQSAMFAGGNDGGSAYIYSINNTAGTYDQYQFLTSTSATVLLDSLEPDKLVVGLRDSADNGIFIFDYSTKSLRKIYSGAVYGLQVMRR